jgi:large subunit ribosomal protein L5
MSLRDKYFTEIAPILEKEFDVKNKMAVPKITKIVVNLGAGSLHKEKALKEALIKDIATITGQTPSVRLAKLSIATFGIRAGMAVGLTATLRGVRMYSFLEKLISVALPRLRDFRGISTRGFDKRGNYTMGLTEHTIFPDIDLAKVTKSWGMEITIVTNAGNPERSRRLLELLGMPFEKEIK